MNQLTKEQFEKLSLEDKKGYLELLEKQEEFQKYNANRYFTPYEYQKKFFDLGKEVRIRALIAANRCGKSYSAAMEVAYHLTGRYPDWWEGRRFDKPVKAAAAGVTSDQVREVLQKELVGTDNRDIVSELGTGSVPRDYFDADMSEKSRSGGYAKIFVKHKSGGMSSLKFFTYAQGMEAMQGFTADLVWLDEQDKNNFDLIFSELVKRTATSRGLVIATFTPLQGITHIVRQFWAEDGPFHKGLINAGWDDVDHLEEDIKAEMLSATQPHLHDAVCKGIPVLGSGAVYNIGEQEIAYDELEIPDTWPRICGVDVGFTTDPTAGIFAAQDPSTGIYYVYDEYGSVDNNTWSAEQHVGKLHSKDCSQIPMIYDSAARSKVGASGKAITELWQEMGLNVLPNSFSNPKWVSEGSSSTSYKAIAPGLSHCYYLMSTGKLKVHAKNCPNFWREFRSYSYDDKGTPSEKDNHWMDAFRYAIMSAEKGLMESPKNTFWYDSPEKDDFEYHSY